MMQRKIRMIALFTAVLLLVAGCGKDTKGLNGREAVDALLSNVIFDTELKENTQNGEFFFPDLPAGSEIVLYSGSGYFADELALITLADESGVKDARKAVDQHLEQVRNQFMNYIPEELPKIDHAVIVENEKSILLCVTADYENAEKILKDGVLAVSPKPSADTTESTEAVEMTIESKPMETTVETQPAETEATEPEYPKLASKSGKFQEFTNAYLVDDAAYEKYGYSDSSANKYAELVNKAASGVNAKVYALPIPTAIGVVMPDDIFPQLEYHSDQNKVIKKLDEKFIDRVTTVNCFPNLMQHRDEYLYFHTDYHWNGRGAYYAYESFCRTKGIEPISLDQRTEKTFPGFLGALYLQSCNKASVLKENPDTVYAYLPKSQNASMQYTDRSGQTYDWNIITDVSGWDSGTKYNAFAAGDNPISVFKNPDVKDDSVCVVVKESYGNALMSYLVDHYSTIYEIDYRYWDGDLVQFTNEKNAADLIFANNLTMIGSDPLIGMLANIINR